MNTNTTDLVLRFLFVFILRDTFQLCLFANPQNSGVLNERSRLVYRGLAFRGGFSNTNGIYRTWYLALYPGPESLWRYEIQQNYALETSPQSPRESFTGNDHECLHEGKLISYEMCHYTCLGLQHRRIRGGLCTNNVCFCDWDIPDHPLYYEHTYLSLTSSKNIKDEDSATLSNFILESVSDGSTIDSDSGLPLSTPSEDDREIPGQDVESLQENHPEDPALEPGPSNSRDECLADRTRCRYGEKIIKRDQCDFLCLIFGIKNDIKIKKGICYKGECYCKYTRFGFNAKSKLTNLEREASHFLRENTLRFVMDDNSPFCDFRPGSSSTQ